MVDARPDELPSSIAYRELAYAEADRLYGVISLLLGDDQVSETVALEAWRRVWQAYEHGQVFGDAEELLFRWGIRSALNRLSRSSDLRGYQLPTTSDDRWISVMGVVQSLAPQQRAAVLLTVRGGVERRVAALACAISADRVADAAFAARQEYRVAKGVPPPSGPECQEMAPLLAAQQDGTSRADQDERVSQHLAACEVCQAARAAYLEFDDVLKTLAGPSARTSPVDAALDVPSAGPARPRGLRRLTGLATGPVGIVLVLVVAVILFRDCGETTIKTGIGRTSDLIFARDGAAIMVLDAGSGREAGRLGTGVLSADGQRLYGTRLGCRGQSSATTIWLGDLGVFETSDLGCAEGRLTPVAVDDSLGRLYLTDETAENLLVFDLNERRLAANVLRADGVRLAFAPETALATTARDVLLTIGSKGESGLSPIMVRTDLRGLRVESTASIADSVGPQVALISSDEGDSVWIYDVDSGRLVKIAVQNGAILREGNLRESSSSPAVISSAPRVRHGAIAVSPGGGTFFALLPEGGIAVVPAERLEVEKKLAPERRHAAVAVSTDGKNVYALQTDGTYVVLDSTTGAERLRRQQVQGKEILQVNPGD